MNALPEDKGGTRPTLLLVDDDEVELSNLQRQVIHGEPTLGQPKVDSAADKMRALNSAITVETAIDTFRL